MMELSEGPDKTGRLVALAPRWPSQRPSSAPFAPLLGSILEACHLGSAISVRGRGRFWVEPGMGETSSYSEVQKGSRPTRGQVSRAREG